MVTDPFVGPQHIPSSGQEANVAWIDLMGVGDAMSRSHESAATNVGKLYAAVDNHDEIDQMTVYPMSDGLYVIDTSMEYLSGFLVDLFFQFGKLTYERNKDDSDDYGPWLGFLLRGGVAQGTVYYGEEFDEDGNSDLSDNNWMDNMVFGEPIANAHNVERSASPYAIVLHETIDDNTTNWKWWKETEDSVDDCIVDYLGAHFEWASNNIDDLTYEEENLEHHALKAEEYFELDNGHFDI